MCLNLTWSWMPPVCVLFAYMCEVVQYLIFPDLSSCLAALYSSHSVFFSTAQSASAADSAPVRALEILLDASHRPPTQVRWRPFKWNSCRALVFQEACGVNDVCSPTLVSLLNRQLISPRRSTWESCIQVKELTADSVDFFSCKIHPFSLSD